MTGKEFEEIVLRMSGRHRRSGPKPGAASWAADRLCVHKDTICRWIRGSAKPIPDWAEREVNRWEGETGKCQGTIKPLIL